MLLLGIVLVTAVLSNEVYEFNDSEEILFTYEMQGVKVDVLKRGKQFQLFRILFCLRSPCPII